MSSIAEEAYMNSTAPTSELHNWNTRREANGLLTLAIVLLLGYAASGSAQAQSFISLYSFTGGTDGANPAAALVRDAKGNLYGTTSLGGNPGCYSNYGCGTVFKLDSTGHETTLYSFTGGADGANPFGGLVRLHGDLFGTTAKGGTTNNGTVFKIDIPGKESGTETVVHSFVMAGGIDGATPDTGGLLRDKQGNLYGTTIDGGSFNFGTVFKIDTAGTESVLYSFAGANGDGSTPDSRLVRDKQGNLYGTTLWGGAHSSGTVYMIDTTGQETVLYSFSGAGGDGSYPLGGLVRDAKGNLYGTTSFGGAYGFGTVYKLDVARKETVLYSFAGGTDGAVPRAGLLRIHGNLYGTTNRGGDPTCPGGGCGTVFKLDPAGNETLLHVFTLTDGGYPASGLVRDKLGNLYGTTVGGGNSGCQPGMGGCGTIFQVTP